MIVKHREWLVPRKVYQVVGKVMKKTTSQEREEIGTIKWAVNLRGKYSVAMLVNVAVKGLENPVVSMPFHADGGANKLEIVSDGIIKFTTPTGSINFEYPKDAQPQLIDKMNADTMAVRLPVPESNKISFRFSENQ